MHKHRLKTTWTSSTNLPLHPDLHSCSWAHCPPPRLYIGSIQLRCSIFTHQQWALHPLLPQARAMGWAPRPRLAASSRPGTRRVEPRRRLLLPLLPQRARPRRYASAGIQRGLRVAPRPPWPGRWKRSCPRTCCVWRWGGGQGAGGLRSCLREREVKGGRAGPGCGAAGSGWGGPGSALTPGCSGPPPVGAAPLPPSRCPSLGSGYFHFLHLSTRLLFWHSECLLCPLRDAFTYVQTRVFSSVFSLRPATVWTALLQLHQQGAATMSCPREGLIVYCAPWFSVSWTTFPPSSHRLTHMLFVLPWPAHHACSFESQVRWI